MKVSLFITCLSDTFFPGVGIATVHLVRKYGFEVDFPENQTCCGQPAFNSGYQHEAKKAAQQLIRSLEHSQVVVCPSGSCVSMIKHYYPYLFAADEEWRNQAQELADKTYEFSQFIAQFVGIEKIEAAYKGKATYHHSCHMMRGLGVTSEPVNLLKNIQGLEVFDLPYEHDCCGFGGTFAIKMSSISEQMVDEKVEHILSTQANLLVGSDMACLMNIEGRLRRLGHAIQVFHLAEILYEGVRNVESGAETSI